MLTFHGESRWSMRRVHGSVEQVAAWIEDKIGFIFKQAFLKGPHTPGSLEMPMECEFYWEPYSETFAEIKQQEEYCYNIWKGFVGYINGIPCDPDSPNSLHDWEKELIDNWLESRKQMGLVLVSIDESVIETRCDVLGSREHRCNIVKFKKLKNDH